MKEKKKQKALEKEIRALVRERGEQDKKLKALDEDFVKTEAKLSAAVQEKTSLLANIACLKKQLLELTRANELLKSKTALAKQEDMEMKLQEVQRNLEHSKGKVAQLEEKLAQVTTDCSSRPRVVGDRDGGSEREREGASERGKERAREGRSEREREGASERASQSARPPAQARPFMVVPEGRGTVCTPLQETCDIRSSDALKSSLSSETHQRIRKQKSETNLSSEKSVLTPVTGRRLASLGATPANGTLKPKKDFILMKEKKKQKALEKEIRALVRERGEQDKKLKALDEDFVKTEAKLSAAVQEKTSLLANIACLKKQLLELTRANELLKSKLSEDGVQKKMSSLCMELMKLRNKRDAKEKTALAKQEDMEMKLQEVQRNLEHSKGKVAQLEEKLSATEREKVEEKSDTEKLLEYITELSSVAETVEKYKLDVAQMEETVIKKDQDIGVLKDTLKTREEESFKLIKELNERCDLLQQEKEKELSESREKLLSMNAEIEDLKKKIVLKEQEHQKLLQKHEEVVSQLQQEKESSASMHQKLLEFQDEVTSERHLLEEELNDVTNELNKLHAKEKKAEKLVKRLEQEIKSQALELAQMEVKLKGKNAELEQINDKHSNAVSQIQEEHRNTLHKLGETVDEFESYKKTTAEEICSLKLENTSLQEEVANLKKTGQDNLQLLQEAEHAKNKAEDECARMLLEVQTKFALKEAETERTKESCLAQVTKLQEELEERTEDLKRQLEVERSRKIINEDVTSSLKEEIKTWRNLYEELHNKTKPFQQQLDAFEAEKNALLNEHGAAQEELNKLSDAYAKLLGHQNQKQKIKHVMKLKEENTHLKQPANGTLKPKKDFILMKEKKKQKALEKEPANGTLKPKKDFILMKEKKKQKALEKEIRALVRERGEQDKKLKALDEDFVKTEAKLSAAVQEKTSLLANIACLKKQLLELTRANELLKSKTALAKQEDMEMKLQEVQRNLEHSKGKVAQLEEKL
ncbi:PREDICTED: hyaluronan mediated motility receptor-like [Calidris pugnax]|uniref:hyaluronan mediated motility receptor-like n=1 Tax=Calidris pugnax TaxID=198806 RepID=UPI00071C41AB|nr:PREDICTED: hyaluronan mediated motility receptor-like [Calidris pugnax]